jgi:two-component system cell cycle sensor histidine kinase/response regulator CckA
MTIEPSPRAAFEHADTGEENARLRRRCSVLAAELRMSAAISENLLQRRELDPAVHEALAACLAACGVSGGALYLLDADACMQVRWVGAQRRWTHDQLRGFFGHEAQLRAIIEAGRSTYVPAETAATALEQALLSACDADTLLITPLTHLDNVFGALVLSGPGAGGEVERDELFALADGIAGQIAQVLAVASACAEERRARERAEQQAALFNALLVHVPDCVAHLDPRATILFVNNAMRASQPDMSTGRDWLAMQRAERRELVERAFDVVISTGEPTSYETTSTAPDAGQRWYENRLGPVLRSGEIIGATLVARDITEKKQAEAQLVVADRMASFGMLAASVAHEINNPLAAMMINLELISRDLATYSSSAENERVRKELEGAREGGRRVTQVVRDLKIFSRSSETLTRVKLRSVLESSLRMAGNEIRHRARVKTAFADVPTVDGDESRLGQVFLNLIVNAAQAMSGGDAEHNELRVETSLDEQGRVLVSVVDTGCGIPPDDRAQIFRPFFTTKPQGVGTGLGLSICARIVRSMGGSIGFESEVGKGSRFWVALPPSTRDALPSSRPVAEAARAGRRGRILIVEDDRMVADVIRRFLIREHDVRVVPQAQEALQLITREPCFDVILCDLMLPQMTGEELFAAVSEVQPQQAERMVFMTGGAFTPTARRFLSSVKNHSMEKPFDLQALRRLLDELVR